MKALANVVAIVLACGGMASKAMAQQSVTLTSTADFQKGNYEGLISTAADRLTRDRITAGTVGAWNATSALPSARMWHSSVAHNGFLYAIGGGTSLFASLSDVLYAPINANGTVGGWSTTTALPSGRLYHTSVAYNGFVYAIGGGTTIGNILSDVLVAPINANGSVGSWSTTTALPAVRFVHSTVVHNGFIYVIGGSPDGATVYNDVLFAPLHANGTVGAWSTSTALPSGRVFHSSVAQGGYLYVVAGQGSDANYTPTSEVTVAPINANGSIGAWTTTTALPSARSNHTCAVYNGFVHVVGGDTRFGGGSPFGDVLLAPLNDNGSIGPWTSTSPLPSARAYHASVAYNGIVYALGGGDATLTPSSDVVLAPINADAGNANQTPSRLRGVHSQLVDLQADTNTRYVLLNGQASSGGLVRLQVRVAPDGTDVFGTETVVATVNLGTAVQVPGNGRYVWIRVTLDDTATSNASQPTFISDITVSPTDPTPPPPPPPPSPPPVISPPPVRSSIVDPRDDDILPCAAGTSAAPVGLVALAGLILLAAAARRR